MKQIILVTALLLTSAIINAQLYIGVGGGYSTAKAPVFKFEMGLAADNMKVYLSPVIHVTNDANTPQIIGFRTAYNISSFEPNIGADYHFLSSDLYARDKPDQRIHLGYGLTKYFEAVPVKIDVGVSGKCYFATIGIYKILD